jgi:hypothetical protein
MSASLVKWYGLDEYMAELRAFPLALTAEGNGIAKDTADAAASEVRAAYPKRTGNLRKGVRVRKKYRRETLRASYEVRNTAPHAYIYEHGTRARHTRYGADRGSMPAGNVFIRITERHWREFVERIKDLLRERGGKVA